MGKFNYWERRGEKQVSELSTFISWIPWVTVVRHCALKNLKLIKTSLWWERFFIFILKKPNKPRQNKQTLNQTKKKRYPAKSFSCVLLVHMLVLCAHCAIKPWQTATLLRSRSRTRNTESIMSERHDVLNEFHSLKNEAHCRLDRGLGQVTCFLCKNSSHRVNLIGASNLTVQLFCL